MTRRGLKVKVKGQANAVHLISIEGSLIFGFSASENPEWFILLVPAYSGGPGKKAVKRVLFVVV